MELFKISIIHPSRGRPEQALATKKNWLLKADDPESIQYNMVVDNDDPEINKYRCNTDRCFYGDNKSAIHAINSMVRFCHADLFIVVSDDFDCPLHWDTLLLEALNGKSDFCVKTKDGYQKTLITLPILDRLFYNRFGYIYNPIYTHMGADKEMTAVSQMLGRTIYLDIEFTHNHYLAKKGICDHTNIRNNLSMEAGKRLFNERLKVNFGLINPPNQYHKITRY